MKRGVDPRPDRPCFRQRPCLHRNRQALPGRVYVKTDLLPSLTVGVPFGATSNERHTEPRALARGARPPFSHRFVTAGWSPDLSRRLSLASQAAETECKSIPLRHFPATCSRRCSSLSFEQGECGFRHSRRRDPRHAAMIDRTFAFQAWAAFDRFAHHARQRTRWARADIVGRPENRHRRNAQRGSDVHRARIVGQIHAARRRHLDKLAERRLPREIPSRCAQAPRSRLAHSSRSSFDPNTATDAPISRATRFADSAKRSGSQRFADPYAAPGLTPITTSPNPNSRSRRTPPRAQPRAIQPDQVVRRHPVDDARHAAAVPDNKTSHAEGSRPDAAPESRASTADSARPAHIRCAPESAPPTRSPQLRTRSAARSRN